MLSADKDGEGPSQISPLFYVDYNYFSIEFFEELLHERSEAQAEMVVVSPNMCEPGSDTELRNSSFQDRAARYTVP